MPTLRQVQDYIGNRRKKIGDNNNIPELKSFLDSIQYNTNTSDNKLFPFGIELGDGSDDFYFHLGFTSLLVTKLNKIMTFFFEVIMCWFHLKANDEEFLPLNINNLHNSLSEDKY